MPKARALYPLVVLPTRMALLAMVDLPVPPLVPARAVDRVRLFAVIETLTVELAVIVIDVAFVVKPPEFK